VICLIILAFIFLTPPSIFHDRPDFMRVSKTEPVRRTKDNNGNTVYTVQVNTPAFTSAKTVEKAAIDRLHQVVHEKFEISKTAPVYDTRGVLVAYSIWIDLGVQPF
jgi:hypothetical protein